MARQKSMFQRRAIGQIRAGRCVRIITRVLSSGGKDVGEEEQLESGCTKFEVMKTVAFNVHTTFDWFFLIQHEHPT